MHVRTLIVLVVGGIVAFFLHREEARGTFVAWDRGHVEWLLANRKLPVREIAGKVIFAKLDDADHAESERQFEAWPPSPGEWGGLLEEMRGYGIKTLVLPAMSGLGTETPDSGLRKISSELPGLLFGVRAEGRGEGENAVTPGLLNDVVGDRMKIPDFVTIPGAAGVGAYGAWGVTQVDLSEHGDARPGFDGGAWRVPLLFRQGERVFASLILQALLRQGDVPLDKVRVVLGEAVEMGTLGRVPVDAAGVFRWYDHPVNHQPLAVMNVDTFKMNPQQIERFLTPTDPTRQLLPSLKGSLCWVGENDESSRRHVRPDGARVSQAEMSAHTLNAMLAGRNVRPLTGLMQAITLAGVVAYGWWMTGRSRWGVIRFTLLGVLLLALLSMLVMQSSGMWMPVIPGLVVLASLAILSLLAGTGEKPPQ